METLTQIIAADEDEFESVGDSPNPVDEWSGIELRNVGIAEIAMLHCILTGDPFDEAVTHYEPLYVSEAEGTIVLRLADEATDRLARLDEDGLDAVAGELAAAEEFEDAGWQPDAVADMVTSLAELANLAMAQDQALFIRILPLQS